MSKYLKKRLDETAVDNMRINLSVQQHKLGSEPVCDFCGQAETIWVYGSHRMSTGQVIDCWRWAACAKCSRLVDNNNWDAIASRVSSRLNQILRIPAYQCKVAAMFALQEFHKFAIKTEEK